MFINFSDIPGNHNLFLDYVYEFENVKSFYKGNFREKEEYLKAFRRITESRSGSNRNLSEILASQYQGFSPSVKTQKNISHLKENKTLAVVTGQQLGILGGPLYTFYKIITAIKLSNYLAERYDDYNFVPIFWLEGDDHDFNEIRSVSVLNDTNDVVKIDYDEALEDEENKGSVGYIKINQTVNAFFSFGQYLDIVPVRASKGLALRWCAEQLDIPLENILAAGGSGADEDMMRGNTMAVVVANRHHEELSMADIERIYFAERGYAAGIIEAIDHYRFFDSGA